MVMVIVCYSYSCCIHLCPRPSRTGIGVSLPVSFLWFAPHSRGRGVSCISKLTLAGGQLEEG